MNNIISTHDQKRIDKTRSLLVEFNLNPEHVDAIQDEVINPAAFAPYHNAQHLMTVGIAATRLGRYYTSNTNSAHIGSLLLAGLYHDINHSQGKYGDSVNVSRAVNDMISVMSQLQKDLADDTLTEIAELILSTKYPHNEPRNLNEKIMQDSDLLQWIEPDVDRWHEGLGKEMGQTINFENTKLFISKNRINTYQARVELHSHGLLSKSW